MKKLLLCLIVPLIVCGVALAAPLTANRVIKSAGGQATANSIITDNGTNVGVGTASPAAKLDVAGTGNFSGAVTAASFNGNASTASALATAGTSCNAGYYARGIDASGNAVNCSADQSSGASTINWSDPSMLAAAQSANINWSDIKSMEIQGTGINWSDAGAIAATSATIAGNLVVNGTGATTFNTGYVAVADSIATMGIAQTANNLYVKGDLEVDGTIYGTGGGTGTVTSVSVTTANGVSGSVATATTTPAITLTLGAITPTTVSPSGDVNIGSAATTYATANADLFVKGNLSVDSSIYSTSAGNVGIGTTSPSELLDVVGGSIKAAGYKSSDGSAGVTVTTCTGFKNGLCTSGT